MLCHKLVVSFDKLILKSVVGFDNQADSEGAFLQIWRLRLQADLAGCFVTSLFFDLDKLSLTLLLILTSRS